MHAAYIIWSSPTFFFESVASSLFDLSDVPGDYDSLQPSFRSGFSNFTTPLSPDSSPLVPEADSPPSDDRRKDPSPALPFFPVTFSRSPPFLSRLPSQFMSAGSVFPRDAFAGV